MTTQLDLTKAITDRLNPAAVKRFFNQMGSSLTNNLTPNAYQAYLQVITWAILERLNAYAPPLPPLDEDRVGLIVDRSIRGMCNIIPEDLGYPSSSIPCLESRLIWYSLKVCGDELI